MDWMKNAEKGRDILKKYRLVFLIVISGLILMLIPEKKDTESIRPEVSVVQQKDLQQSLQEILSLIHGAGKVAVLLTEKTGEETIYQTDADDSHGANTENRKQSTVLTTNAAREETGLIRQINPPTLRGAVIVCQGGDDPKVKLAIVEAVKGATGLPSNCISVLKMK